MRHVGLAAGLLMICSQVAAAQFDADIALTYAGHLHATAPRTTERGMRAHVKFAHDQQDFGLRAEGRIRWNDAYRSPAYSPEARDAYRYSADWRELYMVTNVDAWNLSFGLQQVVWGKADNLRVLDQVNPVDFRDFVLPDLNDYRKPVWMLRGNRNIGDWNVELLYLPRFEPTEFARSGSEYAIPLLDPQVLQSVTLLPEKRPSHSIRNGELGMQLSRSYEGLDLSLFLFHTRDDNPVFRQSLQFDAQGNPFPALQAEYRRQFMSGASVARSFSNGMVLRAEAAYVPNFTYMVNAGSSDGLTESPTLTALLGLDYTWRDWLLSAQASDRYISRWNSNYLVQKHTPVYTLSATGSSLGGRLESRIALSTFSQHGDGSWLQLRTTWKPDDHWAYTVGTDFFSGRRLGLFGQFRDKDRLWLELKYRF
ncbi:MAG TPA: DUF1302 family protein [Noviherbaspirillum sp.]|nr:DUF1302 family protein [Noviherbaspirillum sp.]